MTKFRKQQILLGRARIMAFTVAAQPSRLKALNWHLRFQTSSSSLLLSTREGPTACRTTRLNYVHTLKTCRPLLKHPKQSSRRTLLAKKRNSSASPALRKAWSPVLCRPQPKQILPPALRLTSFHFLTPQSLKGTLFISLLPRRRRRLPVPLLS